MNQIQLAEYSALAILAAIVVYALAFLAFSVDIAKTATYRADKRLEKIQSAKQSQVATLVRQSQATTTEVSGGSNSTQGAAILLASVGTLLLGLGMLLRGLATARVPWANMYEFSMTSTAMIMAIYLLLSYRVKELKALGLFILTPLMFLMLIAQTQWIVPAAELVPSLQNSYWLTIHVIVAILSISLFSIAAITSVLQLQQHAREERLLLENEPRFKFLAKLDPLLAKLPGAYTLERISFQLNSIGFVFWSFTLIFGAIWAEKAWGRYWGWDPKEVWTFVIWVIYAAYLHARFTKGFRGKGAAYFALAGMAGIIVNYTIVNTVINGYHSYSGL